MKIIVFIALFDLSMEVFRWLQVGFKQNNNGGKVLCFIMAFLRVIACAALACLLTGGR